MATIITSKNGIANVVLDTATNDKIVSANQYSSSGNTRSLHDTTTGSDYQVPANRKLIITSCTVWYGRASTPSEVRLWDSASSDSATGTQMIWDMYNEEIQNMTFPFYAEIAQNRYVNVTEAVGTGFVWLSISGVETDA
jgi:hypothetical protein